MSGFFTKKISRVVEAKSSFYGHRFGGPPLHSGIKYKGCETPLHILYNLNMHDPQLGIEMPGINWLPLYYGFPYNATDLGYQIISDIEIKILFQSYTTAHEDFPYDGFPKELPQRCVELAPISHEDHKTLVFCVRANTERSQDAISSHDKLLVEAMGYPFTQIGGIQEMVQGQPDMRCPNPDCANHKFTCFMKVFAVVWNSPIRDADLTLWGEDMDDSQLIYQMCPKCQSISVCNRCS